MTSRVPRPGSYKEPPVSNPPHWSTSPYIKSLWRSIVEITGIDYWYKLPTARTFSLTLHIKRTCQLAGAAAMSTFGLYALHNWLQQRTYGKSGPWNFFGASIHTLALGAMAMLSIVYGGYGIGSRLLITAEEYHEYLSNKYVGASYDI